MLERVNLWLVRSAYVAAVAVFAVVVAQFYLPGKGFTYLLTLGQSGKETYLPEIRNSNVYFEKDLDGYDAQHYVQIAMRPGLDDPELKSAVDNLPYRARRILISWMSWGMGLGDPVRAMHAFTVQNMISWLALAVLLLRWFPPDRWGNFARWGAVLFSFGVCFSLRGSLVDGPSLFLIAAGAALVETGRTWMGAAVLGVAGLGKETNLLSGGAMIRDWPRSRSEWLKLAGQGALVALPLAVWLVVLQAWMGNVGDSGLRNFSTIAAGYSRRWVEIFERARLSEWDQFSIGMLAVHLGLTVQWLFLALRPRFAEIWWRIGAAFAVLMPFLGDAVWEGYPGAAARVLLPMTLAFNVLVPRGRAWVLLLIAGNIGLFVSPEVLRLPQDENIRVDGPAELRLSMSTGGAIEPVFGKGWHQPERSRWEFWRWSDRTSELRIENSHEFAVLARATFEIRGIDDRKLTIAIDGRMAWEGVPGRMGQRIVIAEFPIPPAGTSVEFTTDRPGIVPGDKDQRQLAFSLRNFVVELTDRAATVAPP